LTKIGDFNNMNGSLGMILSRFGDFESVGKMKEKKEIDCYKLPLCINTWPS